MSCPSSATPGPTWYHGAPGPAWYPDSWNCEIPRLLALLGTPDTATVCFPGSCAQWDPRLLAPLGTTQDTRQTHTLHGALRLVAAGFLRSMHLCMSVYVFLFCTCLSACDCMREGECIREHMGEGLSVCVHVLRVLARVCGRGPARARACVVPCVCLRLKMRA